MGLHLRSVPIVLDLGMTAPRLPVSIAVSQAFDVIARAVADMETPVATYVRPHPQRKTNHNAYLGAEMLT